MSSALGLLPRSVQLSVLGCVARQFRLWSLLVRCGHRQSCRKSGSGPVAIGAGTGDGHTADDRTTRQRQHRSNEDGDVRGSYH